MTESRMSGLTRGGLLTTLLDYGFLSCLVLAVILEAKTVPLLVLFGLLPAIVFWPRIGWSGLSPSLAGILGPVGLFLGYSALAMWLHPGIGPDDPRPINPDAELYLVATALAGMGLVRGLQIRDIFNKLDLLLPWGLLAVFLGLSYYMFTGQRFDCRVWAEAAWPFIPALLFATLALLSLLAWPDIGRAGRLVRLLIVALSVVVVIGYTGSRGIAVGLGAAFFLIGLAGSSAPLKGRLPSFLSLAPAVILGIVLCALVDHLTGCNSVGRLQTIFAPFSMAARADGLAPAMAAIAVAGLDIADTLNATAAKAADMSIGYRLQIWAVALQAIAEAPLFGHGALSQVLIFEPEGFVHAHNQFLTWLVTGGIVGLLVGLVFLCAPYWITRHMRPEHRVVILSATTILWAVSMMFDSFFHMDFFLHYYCFLLPILYCLASDATRHGGGAA